MKEDAKDTGRPTKYKKEFNDQVYKLALLGLTDVEMSEFLGVCEKTFNNWKGEKDGFLQSLKAGKQIANAKVALSLFNRAVGIEYQERVIVYVSDDDKESHLKNKKLTTEELVDRAGELGIKEIRVSEKYALPETNAATRFLANRSEKWKLNPDNREEDTTGHKGNLVINIGSTDKVEVLPQDENQIVDFTEDGDSTDK